jgi:acyl carrier protein
MVPWAGRSDPYGRFRVMPSVKDEIRATLLEILEEDGIDAPELTDDTVLLETGLDSLGLAVLVTRLETTLGYDPFSLMTEAVYPRTLADFEAIYVKYAPIA